MYVYKAPGASPAGASVIGHWDGWELFEDTQYTVGSPLALTAGVDTVIPNNGGVTVSTQRPTDIAAFYIPGTGVIPGRDGDGINIFFDFKAVPANASETYIDTWIDIGSPVGELYRRSTSFPKGNGIEIGVSASFAVRMSSTWQTNGGKLYMNTSTNCEIYDIKFIFTRTSKAI